MKTKSKDFQQAGNISLVQFATLDGEGFGFKTGASAIDSGDLVIKEVRQEGKVNTLLAINLSDTYFLLTDMDLLKGAKQNRVVNTSVLIAPNSKQEFDVSCVERSRWSYDSPVFKTGPATMEPKMRAAKAASLRSDLKKKEGRTQMKIWNMINEEMVSHNLLNDTEDYNSILESKSREPGTRFKFSPGLSCNGLAVYEGRKLISFEVFGNREAYRYYFERLASKVPGSFREDAGKKTLEKAEAFYRLDDFLDGFESQLESQVEPKTRRIGQLRWSGDQSYPGFELSFEGHPIHMVGFSND